MSYKDAASVLRALKSLKDDEMRNGPEFQFMPGDKADDDGDEPSQEPDSDDDDDEKKVPPSGSRRSQFPVGRISMMSPSSNKTGYFNGGK